MTEIERLLPDGIYLHLPERIYFGQGRMGTTDEATLFLKKEGYWWSNPDLNPDKEPEDEDGSAKNFGKALHAIVLEGPTAYAERFAIIPTKAEVRRDAGEHPTYGPLYCETIPEMEAALEKRGMSPKRMKKDALIEYCKSRAPDIVIWDVFEANWRKANVGKSPLTSVEHRQIEIMNEAVVNHPDVGPLFRFGADHIPLAEVSILWTDEFGIRHRARLDAMLPGTTIDIKTLAATGMRPLNFAVGDHLTKFGYHVQFASQHLARKHAYRFITEGKIYDGTPADEATPATATRFAQEVAWLKRFPTEAPNWSYAWLFYQKPDAKKGLAPIIFPWGEDTGSDLHMDGIRARRQAVETYRTCMATFGPDKPWTRVEPLHTSAQIAGMPRVYLPAHIAMPAVPNEDDDV